MAVGRIDMLKNEEKKKQITSVLYSVFRALILIAVGYTLINPLFQLLANSFKSSADMLDTSVVWIPKHFSFQAYKDAIYVLDYFKSLWNTFCVQILSAVVEIFSCAIAAYGFARFPIPEKKIYYVILLLMVIIPVQMTMLPNYLNYRYFDIGGILGKIGNLIGKDLRINLINTPLTFWLPSILGVGYRAGIFILIYIQFFKDMPKELEEAAWVDGAGPFKTFCSIILPSAGVAMLTVGLLSVIWHWNEYYLSVMYFNKNYSIAVQLSRIGDLIRQAVNVLDIQNSVAITMAGCILYILPVLILYMILQKKFVKSIDRVGIVG